MPLKNNNIEYFDFDFFDQYCINVFITALTVQATKIDVL